METNSERKHVAHTIVFFIFIICNCGGCLLPIGDPPLFWATCRASTSCGRSICGSSGAVVNVALLVIYFLWDTLIAYPKETRKDIQRDETRVRGLKFEGLMPNALLLVGVVLAPRC